MKLFLCDILDRKWTCNDSVAIYAFCKRNGLSYSTESKDGKNRMYFTDYQLEVFVKTWKKLKKEYKYLQWKDSDSFKVKNRIQEIYENLKGEAV